MYQDSSICYDWHVKKAIVDLPVSLKENSKCTSGNSLSPKGAQNKDLGAALQTLLTKVRLSTSATQAKLRLYLNLSHLSV